MTPLKYDGKPDKRFLRKSNEMIVSDSPVLPFKNGYMQFEFIPVTVVDGIVSNKRQGVN